MKKFTLVAAAFGLMMLAACGDDSSSNSSSKSKDPKGRTIYTDMVEAMEAPCSEANMCEVIIMDDPVAQDTLQCVGDRFQSLNGKPNLPACEEKAPSDDQPPSDNPPSDNPPSDAQPSDNPEAPAAETPATDAPAETPAADAPAETPAADAPAGGVVSCVYDIAMKMAVGDEMMDINTKSCSEAAAGSEYAASMTAACVDVPMTDEVPMSVKATVGTGCPEGQTAKCPLADHTVFLYDEADTCDDAK